MGNFFSRLKRQRRTEPTRTSFQKDKRRPSAPLNAKARRAVLIGSVPRAPFKYKETPPHKPGLEVTSKSISALHFHYKKPKLVAPRKLLRDIPVSHSNIIPSSYQDESWKIRRKKQEEAMTAYVRNISKKNLELILANRPLSRIPAPPPLKRTRLLQESNEFKQPKKKRKTRVDTIANMPDILPCGTTKKSVSHSKKQRYLNPRFNPEVLTRERRARLGSHAASFRVQLTSGTPLKFDLNGPRKRPVHPAVDSKERAEKKKRERRYENVTVVSGRLFDVQYRVPRKTTRPGNPLLDSKERSQLKKRCRLVEDVIVYRGTLIDVTYRGQSPFRSDFVRN